MAVKWLIEQSASHQLLWCLDSFVLPNPPLRQAPKRYAQKSKKLKLLKPKNKLKTEKELIQMKFSKKCLNGKKIKWSPLAVKKYIGEFSSKAILKFGMGISLTNHIQMRSFCLLYSQDLTMSDDFNLCYIQIIFNLSTSSAPHKF